MGHTPPPPDLHSKINLPPTGPRPTSPFAPAQWSWGRLSWYNSSGIGLPGLDPLDEATRAQIAAANNVAVALQGGAHNPEIPEAAIETTDAPTA